MDPRRWYERWWFPILCLKRLALCGSSKEEYSSLCRSVQKREWAISSFFWTLWRHRMKQAHEPDYFFSVDLISADFDSLLSSDPRDKSFLRKPPAKKKKKKPPKDAPR